MTKNIKQAMYRGSLWMLFQKSLDRSIGLISTMIVARILSPEDYGLMAMAMAAYGFVEVMSAFGFDVILIQKDKLERHDYDRSWTLRLLVYIVLSTILFSVAHSISLYFREPRVEDIIYVLSFAMLGSGFVNIAVVDFRRELKFRMEFYYNLSIKLVSFIVVVPMAFYYENYWALIFGIVASKISQVIFSYIYRPYMPRLCFKGMKEVIRFSQWIFFTNILAFISNKLPSIMLGRISGPKEAGYYHVGIDIARFASTEITAATNRAVFPGYSKLKNNIVELRANYLEVVGLQSLIVLPIGFGLSALSPYAVEFLLGSNWGGSVPVISTLVIGSTIMAVMSNTYYIFVVLEKLKLTTFMSIVKLLIFAPLLYFLASNYGSLGAAYAFTIVAFIMFFVNLYFLNKIAQISVLQVLKVVVRPFLSALIMMWVLNEYVDLIILPNVLLQVITSVCLGVLVYISSIFLLWKIFLPIKSAEQIVINKLLLYCRKFNLCIVKQ